MHLLLSVSRLVQFPWAFIKAPLFFNHVAKILTDRKMSPIKQVGKPIQSSPFIIRHNTFWIDRCQYLFTIYSNPNVTIKLHVSVFKTIQLNLMDWLTTEFLNIIFCYIQHNLYQFNAVGTEKSLRIKQVFIV